MPFAIWASAWETVSFWLYAGGLLLGVLLSVAVLRSRREVTAKSAWILALLGFPFVATFFYLIFGQKRLERRVIRLRALRILEVETGRRKAQEKPARPWRRRRDTARDMVLGAQRGGAPPPVAGNRFRLLSEGPLAFEVGREAIRSARHHIHLVTYIFRNDPTGRSILALLEDACRRGVEVRVLYDGIGNLGTRAAFFRPIRRAGGTVASFLPFSPFTTGLRVNLRNHRKLLIIDGATAMLGGMNIGDEYATGRDWRDVHACLSGPAVPALQKVFVEDWHFATGELLDREVYFRKVDPAGDVPVQVVASGPDQDDPAAEELMFGALAGAHDTVDIVTPYLVPTEALARALTSSARRGRRIRVLIPEKVDHRLVRWATDAYLPGLIDAGVCIWRHPSMVHGKLVIVDGRWATLGSTNLDMRSLRLNFELNVALPHTPVAEELTRYFEGEIAASRRLTKEDLRASFPLRCVRATAQLLAPVL